MESEIHSYKLFEEDEDDKDNEENNPVHDPEDLKFDVSEDIRMGRIQVLFGHPEAFLSDIGQQLFRSKIYQSNVVAITIETW